MNRRAFLRTIAGTIGTVAIGTLAACAPAPAASPTAAPAAKPAAPAPTTAAAPAPTKAPAAAAPAPTATTAAKPAAAAPTTPPAAAPTTAAAPAATQVAPAATTAAAAKKGGTLNIAVPTFGQEGFLTHTSATVTDGFQEPLYDYVLYYDPNDPFKLTPGWAESFSHRDLKEWTFKIRKGIQWDKGQGEVTAEDIAYSLNLIARDDAKSPDTPYWRARVKNMRVEDPYTLTFKFDRVDAVCAYQISSWRRSLMNSKKYIESVGVDKADREPVGSGPYRLVKHEQGTRSELQGIEGKHWRVGPNWEKLVFLNVPEDSTRLAMVTTGRADIASITLEQLQEAKKAGLTLIPTEGLGQVAIMFGGLFSPKHPQYQAKDAWQDIRLREAMSIAIDRQAINKTYFADLGTYEPTPGNNVAPLSVTANMKIPYDPARAKQLIRDAKLEGFAPKLLSYPYENISQMPQIMEAVAGYWEAVGLKPKITPMDRLAFRALWLKDETNGLMWPWGNPIQPLFEARFEKFFWTGDIGFNIYNDDYLDKTYDDLGTMTDSEKRAKTLADAQKYLVEKWAAIHLLNVPQAMYAAKPDKIASWKPLRAGESTAWEYIVAK